MSKARKKKEEEFEEDEDDEEVFVYTPPDYKPKKYKGIYKKGGHNRCKK